MKSITQLVKIQITTILLFAIFKFFRANFLASENNFIQVLGLSLPNFFEGFLGVTVLTGIGLFFNQHRKIKTNYIYILALFFTAIYVFTQELKIHNLGGNNVYDRNDMLFSFIGLTIGGLLIFIIKPKITAT